MAKSFKFRMQTILDHKQDVEDKEKEKLGKILQKLEQAMMYLASLEQKRDHTRLELKEKQRAGGIKIEDLKIINAYLKKLDNDIINARLMIEQIKAEERLQRAALLRAAQDRQAFEKIKEKHKQQFDEEENEKERKLIDELATIKFARAQMEEHLKQEAHERGDYKDYPEE
jgi:flagellar FliJ protein